MKVRPLHDQVIVQRLEEEERTKGGLLSYTAKEKRLRKGNCRGAGRNKKDGTKIPLEVKKGIGSLCKICRTEVKMDGEEYLIMKEEDILAILNNG